MKIKNIVSPAMDAAVEESLISRNPFKSVKLDIGGKETVHHKAIPKDKMSYAEARNTFRRVRSRFQLDGFSAHDFRDTCATEWRENGMQLDLVARLLGHAKTETTERRYVKYREETLNNVRNLM